ncbi:MoaB/Mog domain-containing protein [Protomyces lactucae-debilis]|uniref:MoaB/Mog domain-containing protein n=1 Tax=Protomyces lactucae-debilis TaxID=2754530 RepID=A0A1Y2EYF1_PROLT|nr:MoaB/Mog domain-containing protein [Protomyces lactucae-debilis]ORY76661.1 MoaB/Mog domain-containing protein [Protomyces lactucae-debilis]
MSTTPLTAALLIVSDTCSRDTSQDKSGPKLKAVLIEASPRWQIQHLAICADEIPEIQKHVRGWAADGINLVIASGGTGFAERDVTPEAIEPILTKRAPGLVHAMFAASLEITPLAAMARLVAGVCDKTLVVTIPGSPKGAVENLQAIVKLLPHACDLAANTVQSRMVHAQGTGPIEQQAGLSPSFVKDEESGHRCTGHHDHASDAAPSTNDPLAPVTRRQRHSPWPMISVVQAHQIILEQQITQAHLRKENRSFYDKSLVGSILAEDVYADDDVPAFRASIVDGYAIQAKHGPGVYRVAGVAHAGDSADQVTDGKTVVRITTGAPIPDGADAVVMVEDTELDSASTQGEETTVKINALANVGENVREIGSDIKKGVLMLRAGTTLTTTGGEIGLLASARDAETGISVWRKAVVGVMSTGNELVEPGSSQPLNPGQVRDSNRASLLAAVRGYGFDAVDFGIVADKFGTLSAALKKATDQVDLLITTGGVSMGEMDLLKPTLQRELGATLHFGRVAMKPGKPTTFATVPHDHKPSTLVFALPGNPASALVTFHLFVLPALRRLSGYPEQQLHLPRIPICLDGPVALDARPEYHRVVISVTQAGKLKARSTGGQRSSRVGSLVCNGFLCLPAKTPEKEKLDVGDTVEAMLCGELQLSKD